MKLTLAITVYNRYDLLLESFAQVIDDHRIDEILICDDHSKEEYWNKIKELPKFNPKIKVVRQLENRGMLVNKRDAVFNSKNEWVILFDSDNVIGKDYIDAIESQFERDDIELQKHLTHPSYPIYMPSFAAPSFDYRKFKSATWGGALMPPIDDDKCFMALNTCNYVVRRENYLSVWKDNNQIKGTDTLWFNYLWLKNGNLFFVVQDMQYHHRVHDGSTYLENAEYNSHIGKKIKQLIYSHYYGND